MKIRVRLHKRTVVAEITEENANISHLRTSAQDLFALSSLDEFQLSLNGRDPLDEDETKLSSLGIVSGDLVHVLDKRDHEPQQKLDSTQSTQMNQPGAGNDTNPKENTVEEMNSESNVAKKAKTDGASSRPETSSDPAPSTSTAEEADRVTESHGAHEMEDDAEMDDTECIKDALVNRYLNEPLRVQESTPQEVPQVLEQMYRECQPADLHECIVVLLHVLMQEARFRLADQPQASNGQLSIAAIKKSGHYDLLYSHDTCGDVVFRLTLVPMRSRLIAHGLVLNCESSINVSLQIDTSMYVKSCENSAAETYQNLPKLARSFKDSVAYSLLQAVQSELGVLPQGTLLGLMSELQTQILGFLDADSLCKLSAVCSQLRDITQDAALWRRLYLREFGRRQDNDLAQNWRQMYKQKHCDRAAFRYRMRRPSPWIGHDPFHPYGVLPNNPHPPPLPHAPPFFIGGDYDRDPNFPGLGVPRPMFGLPRPLQPRYDPIGPDLMRPPRPGPGGGMWDDQGPLAMGGAYAGNNAAGGLMGNPRCPRSNRSNYLPRMH